MAITTYSELQTHIADTLARSDLTSFIPTLISLAEGYLRTEPRLMVREAETTATLTPTAGVVTLPTDFGGFREAWANTSPLSPLELVEPSVIRSDYPDTAAGTPYVCAIIGESLTVRPVTSSTIGLIYYRKVPALTDAATTNWLLDAFPHVYLMASLVQVEAFVKDDRRINTWNAMLEVALGRVKSADTVQRFGRVRGRVKGPTP
jgi:hypothetical protein